MADVSVNITEPLIQRATQRDSRHCMIAEAIMAAQPHYRNVTVDLATMRWTNPRTGKRYVALTPEAARQALVLFDQGQPIEPFTIALHAIQATANPKRTGERYADGKPKRTKVGRGQEQLRADGTIVGGQPLPTGHLAGGGDVVSNRKHTRRAQQRPRPDGDESNVKLSGGRFRQYGLAQLRA